LELIFLDAWGQIFSEYIGELMFRAHPRKGHLFPKKCLVGNVEFSVCVTDTFVRNIIGANFDGGLVIAE
jgi:hypothetical protein